MLVFEERNRKKEERVKIMHNWNDKNVDWNGIADTVHYIDTNLRRWGRIRVSDAKEKWGMVIISCDFGFFCLLGITHPGYHHYGPYPKWLMSLDIFYISKVVRFFNFAVVPYQQWVYRKVYRAAICKRPHLINEIVAGAEYPELLWSGTVSLEDAQKVDFEAIKEEKVNVPDTLKDNVLNLFRGKRL